MVGKGSGWRQSRGDHPGSVSFIIVIHQQKIGGHFSATKDPSADDSQKRPHFYSKFPEPTNFLRHACPVEALILSSFPNNATKYRRLSCAANLHTIFPCWMQPFLAEANVTVVINQTTSTPPETSLSYGNMEMTRTATLARGILSAPCLGTTRFPSI